jgi:hypothetical protein
MQKTPEIRRLLDYLKSRRQGYDSALPSHLTNALFQTAAVRGVDPAHLVKLPEGGGGNRRSPDQGQGQRLPGCARPRRIRGRRRASAFIAYRRSWLTVIASDLEGNCFHFQETLKLGASYAFVISEMITAVSTCTSSALSDVPEERRNLFSNRTFLLKSRHGRTLTFQTPGEGGRFHYPNSFPGPLPIIWMECVFLSRSQGQLPQPQASSLAD